jgi:predicted transcriptional regulator YdeE
MEPRVVQESEFSVIGIQVRTSNAKEMTGEGAIPKQWGRFFKEGIADKIPNKVGSTFTRSIPNQLRQRSQRRIRLHHWNESEQRV